MKLLTKALEKKLPALRATQPVKLAEKRVAVKFFTPDGAWTWYVVEGQKLEGPEYPAGDFEFFGLVDSGHYKEWGYFHLSELQSARGPWGLPVERDRWLPADATIGSLVTL